MDGQIKFKRCSNCLREIEETKFFLHETLCARTNRKCSKCNEVYAIDEEAEHMLIHIEARCQMCHSMLTRATIEDHLRVCKDINFKQCPYCELDILNDEYNRHEDSCGSRTNLCYICNKNIAKRNYNDHLITCKRDQQSLSNSRADFQILHNIGSRKNEPSSNNSTNQLASSVSAVSSVSATSSIAKLNSTSTRFNNAANTTTNKVANAGRLVMEGNKTPILKQNSLKEPGSESKPMTKNEIKSSIAEENSFLKNLVLENKGTINKITNNKKPIVSKTSLPEYKASIQQSLAEKKEIKKEISESNNYLKESLADAKSSVKVSSNTYVPNVHYGSNRLAKQPSLKEKSTSNKIVEKVTKYERTPETLFFSKMHNKNVELFEREIKRPAEIPKEELKPLPIAVIPKQTQKTQIEEVYDNEAIARRLQMEYDERMALEMNESETNFFKKKTVNDGSIAYRMSESERRQKQENDERAAFAAARMLEDQESNIHRQRILNDEELARKLQEDFNMDRHMQMNNHSNLNDSF